MKEIKSSPPFRYKLLNISGRKLKYLRPGEYTLKVEGYDSHTGVITFCITHVGLYEWKTPIGDPLCI